MLIATNLPRCWCRGAPHPSDRGRGCGNRCCRQPAQPCGPWSLSRPRQRCSHTAGPPSAGGWVAPELSHCAMGTPSSCLTEDGDVFWRILRYKRCTKRSKAWISITTKSVCLYIGAMTPTVLRLSPNVQHFSVTPAWQVTFELDQTTILKQFSTQDAIRFLKKIIITLVNDHLFTLGWWYKLIRIKKQNNNPLHVFWSVTLKQIVNFPWQKEQCVLCLVTLALMGVTSGIRLPFTTIWIKRPTRLNLQKTF